MPSPSRLAAILLTAGASMTTASLAQDAPRPADAPAAPTQPSTEPVINLNPPADPAESPARSITFDLRAGGAYTFPADIDDSPGDVRIARASAGIGIAIPIGERSRLSFDIDEEVSWYLFDDASGLVPGSTDPFELVLSTDLSARFFSQIDSHWSWFVGGLVSFSGEADVDIGDAATFGGFAGARYQFNDRFALSFGLGAKTRLEDDALVIPLIGIDWKVSDRVTLSTEGTKVRIAAELSKEMTVALTGGWELREFRLRDDGPLPDGVVRDARIPIAVSLDWKPRSNIQISVFGGVVVWQEFQFDDSDGDELSETNTDPAPFVGLNAKFTF